MRILNTLFLSLMLIMPVADACGQRVEPFPLHSVRLLDGDGNFPRWRQNQTLDSAWVFSFPVSRLLHTIRTTSGAYSAYEGGYSGRERVEKLGGWESMDCDLRGHAIGHLLSAYALMSQSLPSERGRMEARAKGDSLVAGIRECQLLVGTGYVGAFPEGLLRRNLYGQPVWAPWYTVHKMLAGLIMQYRMCQNETALDVCRDFSRWTERFLSDANLAHYVTPKDNPRHEKIICRNAEDVRRRALRNEFGGIGEAFYDLYAITHDEGTLRNARFFYHNEKTDPLYSGDYNMGTQHCNTFLPKMAAEIRSFTLGLPVNPHAQPCGRSQHDMVDAFWHEIVSRHVLAPGCLSDKEHFFDPKETSRHLTGNTGETCCTYNLLKLTRELYALNPDDDRYFDYYECALYNHILGQQDPETGMVHYFLPTLTGAYKLYSTYDKSFWCCVGSSFESHAKYAESIYWKGKGSMSGAPDTVYVNLFIPSELCAAGIRIRQTTLFPASEETVLEVETDSPVVLKVRQPSWAGKKGYKTYRIRGRKTIRHRLPMSLHTEATPDNPDRIALFYGPLLLAGQLGTEDMDCWSNPELHNDYYGYDYRVPERLRCVGLNPSEVRKTGAMEWQTADGITLRPLFATHRQRYVVYWNKK
ncbi:MAG: beta-L-arabinofuranosidase domain-containing protein [Prevotella sp.]